MSLSIAQKTGQQAQQSGTVAFTLGSTPTVNNVLLAFCSYSQYSNSRTITTPSGWTKFQDNTGSAASGNVDSMAIFYRVVQSGDGTSYSFTISDAGDNTSGSLFEITGASTSSPINGSAVGQLTAPITSEASPSVTPSVIGCLAFAAVACDNAGDVDGAATVSAGWTVQDTEDASYHATYVATKNSLTTDTTTAMSCAFTIASSQSGDGGVIYTVLIAPATGATVNKAAFLPFF
jgi:hypothetical protein